MADDLLFETGTGGDESQGSGGSTAVTNTNPPVNPQPSNTPLDLVFGGDVNEDGVPQVYFGDEVEVNLEGAENLTTGWSWVIEKPDGRLFTDPADDNKDILTFRPVALGFNEAGDYVIRVQFDETGRDGNNLASTTESLIILILLKISDLSIRDPFTIQHFKINAGAFFLFLNNS